MFLNVSQTQTPETLADGTNCREIQADTSSVAGNWRLLSDDEKKRRRKLSYAKRDYLKVNLLGSFQRWRDLRKKLNMSSDKELADFLMDHYESAQKPSSDHDQSPYMHASGSFVAPLSATPSLDRAVIAPHVTSTPTGKETMYKDSSSSVSSGRQTPEEETMTASELEDTEHCGRISLSRLVKELSDRAIQKANKKQITTFDS